jgi:hypothetical protein
MVKANLIPYLLRDKKWSVYKLSQELDGRLSRNQVYKLANDPVISGKTELDTLELIASTLNVGIAELYEESEGVTAEWKNQAGHWIAGIVIEDQGKVYRLIDLENGETITVSRNRVRVPKPTQEGGDNG